MTLPEYLKRNGELVAAQPHWKWFGAWLAAVLETCVGPLDGGLVQVLFGLFLLDTLLGLIHALVSGTFRYWKLSYACVKAAVYFSLLSAAWLFRRSDDLGLLPVGVILATGLEGFLIFTEGMSVLENGEKLLRHMGVDTSRLRKLTRFLERPANDPGKPSPELEPPARPAPARRRRRRRKGSSS